MITKHAANLLGSIWNGVRTTGAGAGAALGTAAGVGFPVYQYMSGEDSIGGAAGSVAGMTAGGFAGKAITAPIGDAIGNAGAKLIASGASLGGKGKVLGTLGGLALKGAGKLTSLVAKAPKTVGMLGGSIFGFEAGRKIGDKYAPIHKRDAMSQVKQASAAGVVARNTKELLSPLWKKRMKITGGVVGAGLAAYYGNKNFNEMRNEMAGVPQYQYQPMYPQQFYNAQQ